MIKEIAELDSFRAGQHIFSLLFALLVVLTGCASTQQIPTETPANTAEVASTSTPKPLPAPTNTPAAPTLTLELKGPSPTPAQVSAENNVSVTSTTTAASDTDLQPPISFGYTHQRADGNRLVDGQGSLPEVQPIDVSLAGQPRWVAAALMGDGTVWAVVLADNRVQAFQVAGDEITEIPISPEQLRPGMPPHLKVEGEKITLLNAPVDAPSPITHPVLLAASGRLAFIHAGGQVMIWDGTEMTSLEVNALPDARLLVDENERLLLLTDASDRYDHGVLGDGIEAASITLIETRPSPRIALTIPIPEPTVVEGIAPIWADLTGDGQREIIVTLSNAAQGAQVVVFNEAGEQIAAGPAIGQGYRWRHQLVAAPFGPNGEVELVDVRTPHIGGVVEFYQLDGDQLRTVAQMPGYTSHVIRTRNLDMAAAGDFDGDGHIELLLPNQARTELGAIRRSGDGAEVAWTLPVDGLISTNLAGVTLADGSLAVGVGRDDGTLRLWLP